MAILFSNSKDAANRLFFFDYLSAPSTVQPGCATLTLNGKDPQYPGSVFRTPTTVTLILNGRQVNPDAPLRPAQAALAFANSTVGLQTVRLITPTLASPVENPDNVFVPTLIQVFHREPAPALITLGGLVSSLTEGGDIGFRSPPPATLTLFGYQYLRTIPPPVDGEIAPLILDGLPPTLHLTLVIEPEVGALAFASNDILADRGFLWIDDAPSPPLTWS